MNLPEFLAELENGKWAIKDKTIRDDGHCPITFVVKKITGKFFPLDEFLTAAKEINLDPYIASQISTASDADYEDSIRYEFMLDYPDQKLITEYQELQGLREMILKACKLEK